MRKTTARIGATATALGLTLAGAPALAGGGHHGHGHDDDTLTTVTDLDGPRGVDSLGRGVTLVTETGGTFSLVIEQWHEEALVIPLGNLPGEFPHAIALGQGVIYLLTGAAGPPPEEEMRSLRGEEAEPIPAAGATLFEWHPGDAAPTPVADIAAYQATDTDPDDQEDFPEDSNPFGLAALRDGSVLVADAAGNDLLQVWPDDRRDRHRRPPQAAPGRGAGGSAGTAARGGRSAAPGRHRDPVGGRRNVGDGGQGRLLVRR